jgi:diadenylate cyclase
LAKKQTARISKAVNLGWKSAVDFLLLTLAIYFVLRWGQHGRVMRFALTLVGLRLLAMLARQYEMLITASLLDGALLLAVLVLLIVYQPEIRRSLASLDILGRLLPPSGAPEQPSMRAVAAAAFSLAEKGCGALIVVQRRDPVDVFVTGATGLSGHISREILESVFQKESPVHDGATVIEDGTILCVGGILPLSQRTDLPQAYGTRHRAAVGLSEVCDAAVIVVSEERGEVTLVQGGKVEVFTRTDHLVERLRRTRVQTNEKNGERWHRWFTAHLKLKATAVLLGVLVWSLTVGMGRTVRTQWVPVEFVRVPAGLTIEEQSTESVRVQMRSSKWVFDSVTLSGMVARISLEGAKAGRQSIVVTPAALEPPPGIHVQTVTPERLVVVLRPELQKGGEGGQGK